MPFAAASVILLLLATLAALIGHCNNDHKTLIACALYTLAGKDGWSLERVSGGFQGEHFILRAGERSWFVKAQPRTEIGKVFERTGIFEKEPKVYSELFPRLQPVLKENDKLWPEAYLCRTGLLVLEDLRGANWHPAPTTLDHAHLKAALTSLAAFHSASLLLELTGASLQADYPAVVRESYFGQEEGHPGMATWTSFISTSGKILREYFPGRDVDGALSALSSVPQLVKPSRTFKNCLCHGDLWNNNIFFKYENGLTLASGLVVFASVVSDASLERPRRSSNPTFQYRYGWSFFSAGAAFVLSELAAVLSVTAYLRRFTTPEEMVRAVVPGAERKLLTAARHTDYGLTEQPQANKQPKKETLVPSTEERIEGPLLKPDLCQTQCQSCLKEAERHLAGSTTAGAPVALRRPRGVLHAGVLGVSDGWSSGGSTPSSASPAQTSRRQTRHQGHVGPPHI